ncbi:MAG: diadenylate cyclase [Maribacter sp.]
MLAFVDIGFLPITIWDVLDVFIVGYLIYRVYTLLRGSMAFNIFIGVVALYGVWWLVRILDMELLSSILDQLVNVGVILLIIIFQPEVRRFLLLVGNSTLKGRSDFFSRLFNQEKDYAAIHKMIDEVQMATFNLSKSKTGALILFSNHGNVEHFANSGVKLDAEISSPMIESIFFKDSPLHDGAMIISESRIKAAGCVLPVIGSINLPQGTGLRHRAGIGATIGTDVISLMVSEETGNISLAKNGELIQLKDTFELEKRLKKIMIKEEYGS